MSKAYIKKPVVINAMQWTGLNRQEICDFCDQAFFTFKDEPGPQMRDMYIHTLEGDMRAKCGDYIIKGVRGEFYPCDRAIFEETYEEVTE